MRQRNLIILRGVSGSGKTTFCNLIKGTKVVCCADDFFIDADGTIIGMRKDWVKRTRLVKKSLTRLWMNLLRRLLSSPMSTPNHPIGSIMLIRQPKLDWL